MVLQYALMRCARLQRTTGHYTATTSDHRGQVCRHTTQHRHVLVVKSGNTERSKVPAPLLHSEEHSYRRRVNGCGVDVVPMRLFIRLLPLSRYYGRPATPEAVTYCRDSEKNTALYLTKQNDDITCFGTTEGGGLLLRAWPTVFKPLCLVGPNAQVRMHTNERGWSHVTYHPPLRKSGLPRAGLCPPKPVDRPL